MGDDGEGFSCFLVTFFLACGDTGESAAYHFSLVHIFSYFLGIFWGYLKKKNKKFPEGLFFCLLVEGGTLDGVGIMAMMIGSYECVFKGKKTNEWVNECVPVRENV